MPIGSSTYVHIFFFFPGPRRGIHGHRARIAKVLIEIDDKKCHLSVSEYMHSDTVLKFDKFDKFIYFTTRRS